MIAFHLVLHIYIYSIPLPHYVSSQLLHFINCLVLCISFFLFFFLSTKLCLPPQKRVSSSVDIILIRFKLLGQARDSIGTVLCIDDEEGIIRIGFTGASRGWQADPADFQRLQEFKVGDWIRVRYTVPAAKHGFGAVTPGSIGVVYGIRPDSSLLIEFCYLPSPWLCEPEEIEPVVPFKVSASFSLFWYGLNLN